MKIAYFDTPSGISGNMVLGALIDAGLSADWLKSELSKLKVDDYSIEVKKVKKNEITATHVDVISMEGHVHRHLSDIEKLINESDFDDACKTKILETFTEIAKAEAKIHGVDISKIHFHEVGAIDSIVDIVGAVIGLKKLGIESIYSSPIPLGQGEIKCQHGVIPVPAPATLALLKGIPVYSKEVNTEITTPTGAALVKSHVKSFGPMPPMEIQTIGYGAGTKSFDFPNVLRLVIGEASSLKKFDDQVLVIETNIDDMNPEILGYATEKLIKAGAKDAYLVPIYMKKNRPGTLLNVIVNPDQLDEILELIFKETSTIGVRVTGAGRYILDRKSKMVETRWGPAEVKSAFYNGKLINSAPEFESCKKLAEANDVPLREVYQELESLIRNSDFEL